MEFDFDRMARLAEEYANDPNLPDPTDEEIRDIVTILHTRPPGSGTA